MASIVLKKMTVSVVMPVYNEKVYVGAVIRRVLDTGLVDELVVVDDCSTDGTTEYLRTVAAYGSRDGCRIVVVFHERNRGKGAALRAGFERVGSDVVIVQDSDLEYDPVDYPKLLAPIFDGRADVVYGSRFLGETHRVLFFWHMVGNKALTFLSNIFTNLNLTDMETCYKAFRTDVLRDIRLTSDRFGFEPEVTAKVAKKGYRIYETSVSYAGRTYAEGKKINWKDGVAAVWHIVRFNIFP